MPSTLRYLKCCPLPAPAAAAAQAIQWLRHGCLPVAVVEGRAPEEKRAAQQARFEARNGFAGGGSRQGASQFQRLGQAVGRLLEELVRGVVWWGGVPLLRPEVGGWGVSCMGGPRANAGEAAGGPMLAEQRAAFSNTAAALAPPAPGPASLLCAGRGGGDVRGARPRGLR